MNKKQNKLGILRAYSTVGNLLSLESNKLKALTELINNRVFKVSDTPLTYRQINYLDNNDILLDTRVDKKSWRRFSIKELVFLSVIKELKVCGVKDSLLKDVSGVFFAKQNVKLSNQAILLPFTKAYIALVIKPDDIYFADIIALRLHEEKAKSYIRINVSEILMEIWEKVGKTRIEYKTESVIFSEVVEDLYIGDKELEVINLIKNGNYKQISVRKSGKNYIVNEEEKSKANMSKKELDKMIEDGDFTDISITRRDGNVVNVKKKNSFKI